MSQKWEPGQYHKDPAVNAILNVARSIQHLADATNGLLYGLKYSKGEGMSLAEALEMGLKDIASAVSDVASATREE